MKKIKNFLRKHENLEFKIKAAYFWMHNLLEHIIPDRLFLKIQYRWRTGLALNLTSPQLYNEKIQWLKLNYRNPVLKQCVDKWEVRRYVADKGLEKILIPAYGPFNTPDEIDLNKLPDSFIMKLTNGSSFNIICQTKSDFDFEKAKIKFKRWIGINFFSARREWAYKDVKNRIMCEDLLQTPDGGLPSDIRFFCFNGKAEVIAVDLDSVEEGIKTSNYKRHLYTTDWQPIDGRIQYPKKKNYEVERPENLKELLQTAESLAEGFPAVRVDLYNLNGAIMFGELTFYHASGYQDIQPREFHMMLGSKLSLSGLESNVQ